MHRTKIIKHAGAEPELKNDPGYENIINHQGGN